MIDALRAAMLSHTDGARLVAEMSTPGPTAEDAAENVVLTGLRAIPLS